MAKFCSVEISCLNIFNCPTNNIKFHSPELFNRKSKMNETRSLRYLIARLLFL
jgi:hypothetical protein